MDVLAAESNSKDPRVCLESTPTENIIAAVPERDPVPQTVFLLGRDALQGQGSIWDGQKQERDSCHKSGPGLVSESPQRTTRSGAGAASCEMEEVSSGDGSLQQTCVLGLGDGCGMKPEGSANEIQGVDADCYKGRPSSGGSSLGSVSHLQRSGGSSSLSVLPQTSTYSQLNRKPLSSLACCPPKDTAFQDQYSCDETEETGSLSEIKGVAENPVRKLGLGSLFSRVSCIVHDARSLFWRSPALLQQLTTSKLQPVGASLSSRVFSIVKESHIFSMIGGSFALSLLNKSPIFSVNALPLVQHLQMNITPPLQPKESAPIIQDCNNGNNTQLSALTIRRSMRKKLVGDVLQVSEEFSRRDLQSPEKQDGNNIPIKLNEVISEPLLKKQRLPLPYSKGGKMVIQASEDVDQAGTINVYSQTLIKFPNPLLKLQTLPLEDLMSVVESISCSVISSQRIIALHWFNVAKCSQPDPQPGLLILTKTGLYTLTANSGPLVLFHHLPLLKLRDILIGFAGQSLRLMGTTEESILGIYTYSQKQTKELCWAVLSAVCSGDSRIHQYQLLHENLMRLSLDCEVRVPDLLLDSGLRLYCQFQKSLTDLLYLIHCNIDQETIPLGEMQLLMYTSVAMHMSCRVHSEQIVQFFLTQTYLGLAREDIVFTKAKFPRFDVLTVCRCSDVRCILLHDEDCSGSVRLDVIIAKAWDRGHSESVTKADTLSEFSSSSHTEVWKLTFSCSAEATCLINHLSNV